MKLKDKKKLSVRWNNWEYDKGWIKLLWNGGEVVHSISMNELLTAWFNYDDEKAEVKIKK